MIAVDRVQKSSIRSHYQLATLFYRLLWGPHIHHGLWTDQGLQIRHNLDWTDRVTKTWEICKQRVQRTGVRHLAKILDREQVDFIEGFDVLLKAYRSGAMQYGAIVAEKPSTDT